MLALMSCCHWILLVITLSWHCNFILMGCQFLKVIICSFGPNYIWLERLMPAHLLWVCKAVSKSQLLLHVSDDCLIFLQWWSPRDSCLGSRQSRNRFFNVSVSKKKSRLHYWMESSRQLSRLETGFSISRSWLGLEKNVSTPIIG